MMLLIGALISTVALASERPALAVMPLRSESLPAAKVKILDNLLVSAVSDLDRYRVVSTADVNAMLGLDKMKQALGCDDVACAAELGGALGVDLLLVSTVDALGDSIVLTTSLLDIKKAQSVTRKRARVHNDENLYYEAIEHIIDDTFGKTSAPATVAMPTAPAGGSGRLKVTSAEPGVISLNGSETSYRTPTVISDLAPGHYVVVVQAGPHRGTSEVDVQAGQVAEVAVALSQEVTGSLRVDSPLPEALVSVDGQPIGKVPQLLSNLPIGMHQVSLGAEGRISYLADVTIEGGKTAEVSSDLAVPAHNAVRPVFLLRLGSLSPTDCSQCLDDEYVGATGAVEYARTLSPWLSARGRVGGSYLDFEEAGDTGSLFVSVGAEAHLPLHTTMSPLPLASHEPVSLFAALDAELLVGQFNSAMLMASGGIRLWYFFVGAAAGVGTPTTIYNEDYYAYDQFSGSQVVKAHFEMDPLVLGVNAGFDVEF